MSDALEFVSSTRVVLGAICLALGGLFVATNVAIVTRLMVFTMLGKKHRTESFVWFVGTALVGVGMFLSWNSLWLWWTGIVLLLLELPLYLWLAVALPMQVYKNRNAPPN